MSGIKNFLAESQQQEELAHYIEIYLKSLQTIRMVSSKIDNAGHISSFLRKQEIREQFNVINTLAESINEEILILQPSKVLVNLNSALTKLYAYFYEILHFINVDTIQVDEKIQQLVSILESPAVSATYQKLRNDGNILTNNNNTLNIPRLLDIIEAELRGIVTVSLSSLANVPDFIRQINELKESINNLQESASSQVSDFKKQFEKDREGFQVVMSQEVAKAKQAVEAVNLTALGAGVEKQFTTFEKEAKHHNLQSWIWLVILSAIIIAAISFVIYLMESGAKPDYSLQQANPDAFKYELAQYILNKVLVISALFYALAICAKNYKAHRHNFVVNKHRQNSLSTFQAFTNAATDQQTKNAILLEATHSIFSNQHTGYMGAESEAESPSKIVEIFRSVNGKP